MRPLDLVREIGSRFGARARSTSPGGLTLTVGDMHSSVELRYALNAEQIPHDQNLKGGKIVYTIPAVSQWWRHYDRWRAASAEAYEAEAKRNPIDTTNLSALELFRRISVLALRVDPDLAEWMLTNREALIEATGDAMQEQQDAMQAQEVEPSRPTSRWPSPVHPSSRHPGPHTAIITDGNAHSELEVLYDEGSFMDEPEFAAALLAFDRDTGSIYVPDNDPQAAEEIASALTQLANRSDELSREPGIDSFERTAQRHASQGLTTLASRVRAIAHRTAPAVQEAAQESNRLVIALHDWRGEKPIGTITVNDTFYLHKDVKRYVVVKARMSQRKDKETGEVTGEPFPAILALALSGADKGSLLPLDMSPGMYASQIRTLKFDGPIWYGKSARARYEQYVDFMQRAGNADLILPFVESAEKPDEPEPPPPASDVADPADADVRFEHTVQGGTTVDWEGGKAHPQFQAIKSIVKHGGFSWMGREAQWRRTNSIGLIETRAPLHRMVRQLHDIGLKVHLDLETGQDVEAAIARRAEHILGRAEMKAERAERKRGEAGTQAEYAQERAEEAIAKADIPGFFPTPPDVAAQVVRLAGIEANQTVLEPSAGHGALANAVRSRAQADGEGGGRVTIDVIETAPEFHQHLVDQGFALVATDLFDPAFEPGTLYDRIVMNPPFEKGAAIDHVLQAWEFLKPGGTLVAVLPESVFFRGDSKHTGFLDWLRGAPMEGSEDAPEGFTEVDLPAQAFGRSSSVKTRIVKIRKSYQAPMEGASQDTASLIETARAQARSSAPGGAAQAVRDATRGIPMGQPILVGHHSERRHRKALEKAERAMRRMIETGQYAEHLQAQSRSLERKAARTSAVDVSKGGRTASSKRRGYGPSQTSDEFLNAMVDLFRKLKKPTGATESKRGYRQKHSIAHSLEWAPTPEQEARRTSFGHAIGDRRHIEVRSDGTWDVVKSWARNKHDAGNMIGESKVPSQDPEAVFEAIVNAINTARSV